MCLAIPGKVVSLDAEQQQATVDYEGLLRNASTMLLPDAKIDDYVLVHAGFIIQILSQEEGEVLTSLAEEVGFYDH